MSHPLPPALGTLLVNVQSASDTAIWQTPSPHQPSEAIVGAVNYHWGGTTWTECVAPLDDDVEDVPPSDVPDERPLVAHEYYDPFVSTEDMKLRFAQFSLI